MNCEKYQELLSDYIDGSLTQSDRNRIEAHLDACGGCAEARSDLEGIVGFCRDHRGEYDAMPNESAMWLRISNIIESEAAVPSSTTVSANAGWWFRLMNRSWRLSFPQLASSVAALVLVVSLVTVVSLRRIAGGGSGLQSAGLALAPNSSSVQDRYRQQQQVIAYWNERVELNKARWNPEMRETFDRNMSWIDTAVNDSLRQLSQNPHDEISEEILNVALNDKVQLLKDFAQL